MTSFSHPEIKILSEQSVLLDWGPVIDRDLNRRIHQLARWIQKEPFEGFREVLPAYASLAVFFDPGHRIFSNENQNPFEVAKDFILDKLHNLPDKPQNGQTNKIEIPVLYNGPDLKQLAGSKNLSVSEIILIHTARVYDVFMLGFLPGFAYLGLVDEKIAAPRLPTPRTRVPAGSVGITGNQTGVYPVESPGGWQLIGTTPLKMFDPIRSKPMLLKPGDEVVFYSITESEFIHLKENA